jgi:hypothetical protein
MTKKKEQEFSEQDLKGFQEFIEAHPDVQVNSNKTNRKDEAIEHSTFLSHDFVRLQKIKNLFSEKLVFAAQFEQGENLIAEQRREIMSLKSQLVQHLKNPQSDFQKSLQEIFNSFFDPPKN